MKRKDYSNLNETIYSDVLPNGLRLFIIPKDKFHKTYANLTVNYGSIDNQFILNDNQKIISMPKGIAHFLEHKMFDKKDYDALDLFSKYGTEANAFTDFTQTSYLFSTTNHIKENLDILLDFVQTPYFTESKIEKEKGIIGQEIKMYNDDPNANLYTNIIRNMYQDFPLNSDIAGSIHSISEVTVNDLYLAHKIFYQPSNMTLTISGNIEPSRVFKDVFNNQSPKAFINHKIIRKFSKSKLMIPKSEDFMNTTIPKVAIGIKGTDQIPQGRAVAKYEIAVSMFLDVLFSSNSDEYLKLYDKGIIDDSFTYEFNNERQFHFAVLMGNTNKISAFVKQIKGLLLNGCEKLNSKLNDFNLIKREEIGRHVFMMNYPDVIADQMGTSINGYTNLYDELDIINKMKISDLQKVANQFIKSDNLSVNIIKPNFK